MVVIHHSQILFIVYLIHTKTRLRGQTNNSWSTCILLLHMFSVYIYHGLFKKALCSFVYKWQSSSWTFDKFFIFTKFKFLLLFGENSYFIKNAQNLQTASGDIHIKQIIFFRNTITVTNSYIDYISLATTSTLYFTKMLVYLFIMHYFVYKNISYECI